MRLAAYLRRANLSDAEFAAQVSKFTRMHRNEIWNYKTFRRSPLPLAISGIERASGGLVTAKDHIKPKAKKPAKAA